VLGFAFRILRSNKLGVFSVETQQLHSNGMLVLERRYFQTRLFPCAMIAPRLSSHSFDLAIIEPWGRSSSSLCFSLIVRTTLPMFVPSNKDTNAG